MKTREVYVFLVTLLFHSVVFSQLTKVNLENMICERAIYKHAITEEKYSTLVKIKFTSKVIELEPGISKVNLDNIVDAEVSEMFRKILKNFGQFEIVKIKPEAVWGDTLVLNKRTGKINSIPDWSQVFNLEFTHLVPVDSVINELSSLSKIKYADKPFQAYSMIEPNDIKFIYGNNWAFNKIEADKAWGITLGSSDVKIGIHDSFTKNIENELHEDLVGKVDKHYNRFGGHGTCVAGIAGANTNNEIGIASLGWKLHLNFYCMTFAASSILDAIEDGVDIINFSWVTTVDSEFNRDAIKTALANGIICVAAAGNNHDDKPVSLFPAAYNFGEVGQVIAVSATELIGNEERFIEGWNYSPGNDVVSDPINSFIDIAAPGRDIMMLDRRSPTKYSRGCGTSLSTPFVSALAGLMLSIDSTLSTNEVYNIITETADKIGQYAYDSSGWNPYLGYGRINAYKALQAVEARTLSSVINIPLEKDFALEQNYPNPFNPQTKINYHIKRSSYVQLVVYNILGKEITTLVNEKQRKGTYTAVFNGVSQPSGVYIFKLNVGSDVDIMKGILIK